MEIQSTLTFVFNSSVSTLSSIPLEANIGILLDLNFSTLSSIPLEANIGINTSPFITRAKTARKCIILKLAEDIAGITVVDTVKLTSDSIKGATDFINLVKNDQIANVPSVFVLNSRRDVIETQLNQSLKISQIFKDKFILLIVVANEEDSFGVNAMDSLRLISQRIIESLTGWTIPEFYTNSVSPLLYTRGAAIGQSTEDYIAWADEYECESLFEKNLT